MTTIATNPVERLNNQSAVDRCIALARMSASQLRDECGYSVITGKTLRLPQRMRRVGRILIARPELAAALKNHPLKSVLELCEAAGKNTRFVY